MSIFDLFPAGYIGIVQSKVLLEAANRKEQKDKK